MFHYNPSTGETGECSAKKGKCPFGSLDSHFTSEEAARAAYEASMAGELLPKTTKSTSTQAVAPRALTADELRFYEPILKDTTSPEMYAHPQGKVFIHDSATGVSRIFKNGRAANSSGSIDDLRAGRGAWKPVDVSGYQSRTADADKIRDEAERRQALKAAGLPANSLLDPRKAGNFTFYKSTRSSWDTSAILPIEERLNPHDPAIENHGVQSYWKYTDRNGKTQWPVFEVWKTADGRYRAVTTSSDSDAPRVTELGTKTIFVHDQTGDGLWGGKTATCVGAFVAAPGGAVIGDVPSQKLPTSTYK